ncbi:TetR family transcriptional regulator [Rhodococcoides trifolii]|uniref:TetR family transcriptional regulator n=1 Tax=Rhodococcoides trifolii TaxID=908250 RepID=A0A917G0E2_9NOCA|nr:TetR/AcrR family transcriptional regulator [Rhodococcus trifolii]GGG16571.1 TetR family transcriptional regulator [Rhodococcus trifolii]
MAKSEEMRLRILDVALRLLSDGGREAVSTRAVTSALHIQAPTIYRIFGDKQGLLDAVALHGFTTHLGTWTGWVPGADPIETIRSGWDMHIEWGVANPHVYSIAYAGPHPGRSSPAADAIDAILRTLIEHAAAAGHLAVPISDAVKMLRAIGTGVVFTLVAMPAAARDIRLSERGREAALSAILTDAAIEPAVTRSGAAMQLKMSLAESNSLSHNERALLGDWLDRLS